MKIENAVPGTRVQVKQGVPGWAGGQRGFVVSHPAVGSFDVLVLMDGIGRTYGFQAHELRRERP
jgi:hypothetical protein